MIAKYNRTSLLLGIPGLCLQIASYILLSIAAGNPALSHFTLLFQLGVLAGLVLLVVGFGYYAKSKGYGAIFGLLGLLSLLGLIILAALPDKAK